MVDGPGRWRVAHCHQTLAYASSSRTLGFEPNTPSTPPDTCTDINWILDKLRSTRHTNFLDLIVTAGHLLSGGILFCSIGSSIRVSLPRKLPTSTSLCFSHSTSHIRRIAPHDLHWKLFLGFLVPHLVHSHSPVVWSSAWS